MCECVLSVSVCECACVFVFEVKISSTWTSEAFVSTLECFLLLDNVVVDPKRPRVNPIK